MTRTGNANVFSEQFRMQTTTTCVTLRILIKLTLFIAIVCFALPAQRCSAEDKLSTSAKRFIALQRAKRHWKHQKWTPGTFYADPAMIRICDALSIETDPLVLGNAVDDHVLDKRGMNGVSLLHWAYFSGNVDAFRFLLKKGADPTSKLSASIARKDCRWLQKGDNIVQTCLRDEDWEFVVTALNHTQDKVQLREELSSILIQSTDPNVIFSLSVQTVKAMIDLGVPLNQRDRYGGTAAYRALLWNRPDITLQLLQSGAELGGATDRGDTIEERLKLIRSRIVAQNGEFSGKYLALQKWIESR